MRRKRVLLFSIVSTLLALLLLEGTLSSLRAVRRVLDVRLMEEQRHTRFDEELGWVNLPGFHSPDFYGPGRAFTTNEQGFRATDGDSSPANQDDTYRIVCLGDSFTMGYGVADDDTFPSHLARLVPGSEVVNMGMGGYGIGQDYLWYLRDGGSVPGDLLLFAFISHDFQRLVSTEFLGYGKPRVRLVDGALVTQNVPVPRGWNRQLLAARAAALTEHLATAALLKRLLGLALSEPAYEPVPHTEFVATAEAIFDDLAALSREREQDFALVYLPQGPRDRELEAWLHDYSRRSGVPLIDFAAVARDLPESERARLRIPGDAHFSSFGNRQVALEIARAGPTLFDDWPEASPGSG